MSAKSGTAFVPTQPQVNLLPPEVRAARGLKVVQRWLGLVVVIALGVAAGVVFLGTLAQRDADAKLADAQAETRDLMTERERYAEVPLVLGRLDTIKTARTIAMSTDVAWPAYLSAIAATAPPGVSIDVMAMTATTPMVVPNLPIDALQAINVGTITFTAKSLTVPDTQAWVMALATVPGFADPWFSSATITEIEGTPFYTVTATVQINEQAYTHRYAETDEVGD